MASGAGDWVIRGFCALTAVGAGKEGLTLLLNDGQGPSVQASWGGNVVPPLAAHTLGSIWTSMAAIAAAGAVSRNPQALSPILALQVLYKTVLLAKSFLPALRRNRPADRPAIKQGLIFAPYIFILPWFIQWGSLLEALRG